MRLRFARLWLALCLALVLPACDAGGDDAWVPEEAPLIEPYSGEDLSHLSGEQLAQRFCQGCHMLPDPQVLDKASWENAVLPMMGWRLGIYERPEVRADSLIEPGLAGQLVEQAGIFPTRQQISPEAWQRLVRYYVDAAPAALPPLPPRPEIRAELDRFRVRIPPFRAEPPMTTLVRVDPQTRRIYVGDTKQDFSTLDILPPSMQPLQTVGLESAPAHMHIGPQRVNVLLMGKMLPTDEPSGILRELVPDPDGTMGSAVRLISGLRRPVHASYGDLNDDGVEDVVISEFGFRTGQLAWYERTPDQRFVPHVLKPLPGALATYVRDFTGDGRLDVLALMSQGDEGIFLFHGQGGGAFREERLLRFPAAYGSTHIDLQDFNGDGHFDILYTNGDNGDYLPVAKPYHGVRIFLNDGSNRFQERYFFPLYGAFQSRARDFDRDGDLDIAAIAFYPDYRTLPTAGFVYLENQGGYRFRPSTFPEVDRGRWITFDTGDTDGDGDEDIVLGSFVAFDPLDGAGLQQQWIQSGPSIVILENTTR